VRIARDFGTVSELFPPGVANVRDLPWRLFDAIRMALVFIGFEELEKEERPPKKIWLDDEKLEAWFQQVEKNRERKYGGKGKGDSDETLEGESVQNRAAESLIRGG
jgi:hypothetical protein